VLLLLVAGKEGGMRLALVEVLVVELTIQDNLVD
jgi:hypothetical protein